MKNKRGWIEIVEAFVAVLLIAGAILIIVNKASFQKSDVSGSIYEIELSILREIQSNSTLRTRIVSVPEPLPIEWEDDRFPPEIKNKIIERTPNSLYCIGKICLMNETCNIEQSSAKDVYSQSGIISSTLQGVSYRQLNLFCWLK